MLDWQFGPDFLTGLVYTDANDQPVLFAGAWQIAEVHMGMDKSWSTPGARYAALKELHAAMEKELKQLQVGQAVTWFDRCSAFTRRLKKLGWVMSEKVSWHRGIF